MRNALTSLKKGALSSLPPAQYYPTYQRGKQFTHKQNGSTGRLGRRILARRYAPMRNAWTHNLAAAIALTGACALLGCNGESDPKGDPSAPSATYAVHVQPATQLEAPSVGNNRAYRPTCQFHVQSANTESTLGVALFDMDVTTTDFARLKFRLSNSTDQHSEEFAQLTTASPLEADSTCPGEPLPEHALVFYQNTKGLFG